MHHRAIECNSREFKSTVNQSTRCWFCRVNWKNYSRISRLANTNHKFYFSPKADSTTKPKRRRFRKNPLRSRICHICGKVFKGPDTMRLHVKTVHSGERPHVCPTCNTAFKRRDHLVCHIRYKHENVSYPKRVRTEGGGGRQKRLCGHCGKLLSSSQLLKEHVNSIHTGHQPYKCEKCDISFSRYSNLYHHAVVRDHKVSTFSKACDICGLDFQSETFYLRHMWKHPENVFCEKCQMKFNNNEDFKQHVESVHEELKPLQCDTCGKKFRTKNSLKLHVRVHTGEKPYECQYCSWRFHKKGQLVVHIYRHTGERPYVCSVCDRGFKQRGDMRKHKAGHAKQMKKESTGWLLIYRLLFPDRLFCLIYLFCIICNKCFSNDVGDFSVEVVEEGSYRICSSWKYIWNNDSNNWIDDSNSQLLVAQTFYCWSTISAKLREVTGTYETKIYKIYNNRR